MSQKLSKNLPKRAAKDHPSHTRRAKSYARSNAKKEKNLINQRKREAANRERGFTGKDIDDAMRKAYGHHYREVRRNIRDGFSSWQNVIADVMTR